MEHQYWAYILSSLSGTLYIGFTSDLDQRQHTTIAPSEWIERQNPRWEDLYADMDKRIAASEEFAGRGRAMTASGSFDSALRPRSG
jgi:predicted GIY-YIG superfamily endonuclease